MISIHTIEDIEYFRGDRSIVSIFVDSGYDAKKINLFLGFRRGFDHHVRSSWHLLVPYRSRYGATGNFSVNDHENGEFNIELSRNIVEKYGLKHKDLPAIIFTFSPRGKDLCVKLGGMGDDEIRELMGTMADFVVEEFEKGPPEIEGYRQAVFDRLELYLRQRKVLGIFKLVAPKISESIAAINNIKGIIK